VDGSGQVTQQNDLIDDIDNRAENVNQRLVDTTSCVRVVSKKDKTCGYCFVILVLFIAIIVALFG
jgi:t-SNARE complex subunit (syntaxin)